MEKIFLLPDLGEGLAQAVIREWYVKAGETVSIDQPLAALETDKALVDIPSPFSGKIIKLYGQINEAIETKAPFILFDIASNEKSSSSSQTVVGSMDHAQRTLGINTEIFDVKNHTRLTPKAWALLKKYHLSDNFLLENFSPSEIITEDALQSTLNNLGFELSNASDHPKKSGEGFDSIRNAMFHTISKAHKAVAPVSLFDKADISEWPSNQDFTARVLQALVKAVKDVPIINSHFDASNHSIKTFESVHCGIAMDSEHGLYVPVISNLENLSSTLIREKINYFKQAVKQKSLQKSDTLSPTILFSNFGVFGAKYATPMVIPPMVCIVGVGQCHHEVMMNAQGEIQNARMLPLSISIDHRIITGGEATRFLASLVRHLHSENN
jgi:2-oxoisovalerate dehydrogenase E2 component (dihydrolipoyl transacylase)